MAEAQGSTDDDQDEAAIAAVIAEQNDRFRTTWGADFTVPGQIVLTRGVADLSNPLLGAVHHRPQPKDFLVVRSQLTPVHGGPLLLQPNDRRSI